MHLTIIPYLGFNGNCKEAVDRYIRVFGGQINYLTFWTKDNIDDPSMWGKVMHMEFDLGGTHMSAGNQPETITNDGAVKLMIHLNSREEASRAIKILAEDGTIITPLQPHPKPDDDGMGAIVKDAFGYQWIFTCPNPDYKG